MEAGCESVGSGRPASDPLVSVIVPAFDAARTVERAVESVLAQTYPRLEVIVVDDGSRDETAAIVSALARRDSRVQLVRQPNLGVAAARNAALERARGEFVAPLDADDYWLPEKIERQVERMRQEGPELAFVYCWSLIVDGDGKLVGLSPPFRLEGWIHPGLVCRNLTGNASTPLIRRSCLQEVGGYDGDLHLLAAQGCEDWDLVLRLAARYPVGVVPEYLVGYRRAAGNMSSNATAMGRSYEIVMQKVAHEHPGRIGPSHRVWRSSFYQYLMHSSIDSLALAPAMAWAARSVRSDPLAALSFGFLGALAGCLVRSALQPVRSRIGHWASPALARLRLLSAHRRLPDPYDRIWASRWSQVLQECRPIDSPAPTRALPH